MGRRWTVLVFLPTMLICCGGTVVGVPLAWIARLTIEAGRGAPSPDAAADSYLMALGYNQQEGLLPILDNRRQKQLLAQWKAYRAAMDGTDPPPSKLEFGALSVGSPVGGEVEVTADVSATWWGVDGRAMSYQSRALTWRIFTREDNGWQVTRVAPTWCGGYVLAPKCRA
ncbi:hypothetical protein [Paractinoplanes globisporus]|uniref:SnoaL-like domain-containing protein n=1 Tax=Paractinoplanes globisporus TaxID=113565 RepID=A0ABW6WLF1_9ACTN|nr:hypothetical protein [Actinoplanes globisporus]